MNFLTLLPTLLPILLPNLRGVFASKEINNIVDLLSDNQPIVQAVLSNLSNHVDLKTNNDKILEGLLSKIPDANLKLNDNDRIEKLEIRVQNLIDQVVLLTKKVK